MGPFLDIALSMLIVLGAGLFLFRRLRGPKRPACAPDARARPQVILGTRLAKALESGRAGQR